MKIRTIFLLFVLILMAVFLVINWTALSTVTAVNLIYTEIQAPLGVLVVGGFAAVVFVLLVYMVWPPVNSAPRFRPRATNASRRLQGGSQRPHRG